MTLFTLLSLFALIFAALALIGVAIWLGSPDRNKQTLSRLDAIGNVTDLSMGHEETPDLRRDEPLSSIPWLDELLRKLDLAQRLGLLVAQAGLNWSAEKLLLLMAFAFAGVAILVYLRTSVLGLAFIFGCCGGTLPLFYVFRKRTKRFIRFRELLPESLDTMVAAIRAGHSFNSALGMTARESPEPVRGELRQAFDEQNFGLELRTSLTNLEHRVPVSDIRIMVAAILIQRDTGGNLTEILERVAYLIREEFRLQRQVRVHTAQGRMTGWILSLLPPVVGFLLYLVNPNHMRVLWERPIGLKMLYGAAIMTTIGALIIRKIVRVRL
jgi:tight adherence protein B